MFDAFADEFADSGFVACGHILLEEWRALVDGGELNIEEINNAQELPFG